MVFCYLNGKSLMTRVTDVAIESVVMSCKHLTALNVSGCKVRSNPPCLLAHVSPQVSVCTFMLVNHCAHKAHIFGELCSISVAS
jgi:hypothetical protein